jgi:hypothetical protein
LTAFDLANGREVWSADLPGDGWRVRVGRGGVVAYSPDARPEEPFTTTVARLARRFADDPRLVVGLIATVAAGWWNRTVPVVLLDPETGERRARRDVPAGGPVAGVHLAGDLALVVTVGRATRLTK